MFSVPAAIQRGGGAPPDYGTDHVFVVKTTAVDEPFRLWLYWTGTINCDVYWGDGSQDYIGSYDQAETLHTYASPGEHIVVIDGQISGMDWNLHDDGDKVIDILNWGENGITNISRAWNGSDGLTVVSATDAGETGACVSFVTTFRLANNLSELHIGDWDMSAANNLTNFFLYTNNITTASYDELLIGWAAQSPSLQSNVTFGANTNTKYSAGAATTARGILTGTHGWNITDGGQV